MSIMKRATRIIEIATRGARTVDGHPMKISADTALTIATALANEGLLALRPSDVSTIEWGQIVGDDVLWWGTSEAAEYKARKSGSPVIRRVGPVTPVQAW